MCCASRTTWTSASRPDRSTTWVLASREGHSFKACSSQTGPPPQMAGFLFWGRRCCRDERTKPSAGCRKVGRGAFTLSPCPSVNETCVLALAARCARADPETHRPHQTRAQGRPGAGRARGPPAKKNAGGSHHRSGRAHPAFPARWFSGLYALSLGTGSLAPIARDALGASPQA
jgi:hypothetical protein